MMKNETIHFLKDFQVPKKTKGGSIQQIDQKNIVSKAEHVSCHKVPLATMDFAAAAAAVPPANYSCHS